MWWRQHDWATDWTFAGQTFSPSFEVTGLSANTTYDFCVSNTLNPVDGVIYELAYVGVPPEPLVKPNAPTGLSVIVSGSTMVVSWNPATDVMVSSYNLKLNGSTIATGITNYKYVLSSGITAGAYSFTLQAVTAWGTISDATASASIDVYVPTTPVVECEDTGDILTIEWSDCKTTFPIDYYTITPSE